MLMTEQIAKIWMTTEGNQFDFARAIEAAILAEQGKLAEQAKAGPVGEVVEETHPDALTAMDTHRLCYVDDSVPVGTPLYLHPSPAPEGMVLVPRDAAWFIAFTREWDHFKHMGSGWKGRFWEALIAAAEKEAGK